MGAPDADKVAPDADKVAPDVKFKPQMRYSAGWIDSIFGQLDTLDDARAIINKTRLQFPNAEFRIKKVIEEILSTEEVLE